MYQRQYGPPQKANILVGLQKIVQAIDAQYWNEKENSPTKTELPDLLETSPNTSLTLTSLTTSLAKVLPIPSRRTTTLALPRQGLLFQTEEVYHSRPFFETQERWKANSTGTSAPS